MWIILDGEEILQLLVVRAIGKSDDIGIGFLIIVDVQMSSPDASRPSSVFPSVPVTTTASANRASANRASASRASASAALDSDDDAVMYSAHILENSTWLAVANALNVDPTVTLKCDEPVESLRIHYRKWLAYQDAWNKIQMMMNRRQWQYPKVGKSELVNLFGKRGFWSTYVRQAYKDISQFPSMVEWLKRGEDEKEPSDKEVWGVKKDKYTFKDLKQWKTQGKLLFPASPDKKKLDKAKAKARDGERKRKDQKDETDDEEDDEEDQDAGQSKGKKKALGHKGDKLLSKSSKSRKK
jgi:hypothetical protein